MVVNAMSVNTPANTPQLQPGCETKNISSDDFHLPSPVRKQYNSVRGTQVPTYTRQTNSLLDVLLDMQRSGYNFYGKASSRYFSTPTASDAFSGEIGGKSQALNDTGKACGAKSL